MTTLCSADCAITASGQAQVIRHHAAATIHFTISLVTNADVYLTREYTVLCMPLGQPPRTAAALPTRFRLRLCKLLAGVLQAIVGM